jgi:hypothetical protein
MDKMVELRNKLSELTVLSQTDLDKIPAGSRPGWESKKRNASDQIETLENDLTQEILKRSITLVVEDKVTVSDGIIKYLESVETQGSILSLDYMMLETRLLNELFVQVKNNTFPFNGPIASQLNILLSEIGDELGVLSMPIVEIPATSRSTLKTRTEALHKIRDLLYNTYQENLKALYLRKVLMSEGRKRLKHSRLAIIVYNVPENNLSEANVLSTKSTTIAATDTIPGAIFASAQSTAEELVKLAIKKMSNKSKKTIAGTVS